MHVDLVVICTGLCRLQYAVDHFAVQFEGKVRNTSVKGLLLPLCSCIFLCVLPTVVCIHYAKYVSVVAL